MRRLLLACGTAALGAAAGFAGYVVSLDPIAADGAPRTAPMRPELGGEPVRFQVRDYAGEPFTMPDGSTFVAECRSLVGVAGPQVARITLITESGDVRGLYNAAHAGTFGWDACTSPWATPGTDSEVPQAIELYGSEGGLLARLDLQERPREHSAPAR